MDTMISFKADSHEDDFIIIAPEEFKHKLIYIFEKLGNSYELKVDLIINNISKEDVEINKLDKYDSVERKLENYTSTCWYGDFDYDTKLLRKYIVDLSIYYKLGYLLWDNEPIESL